MENTKLFVSLVNGTGSKFTDNYDKNYLLNENIVQDRNRTSSIYEDIALTVVYSVFCLLGIIGNGLVIWFGIFRIQKTVNVIWFLSLALADFSFTFLLPLNITQILLKYWAFETFTCKLTQLVLCINLIVSVLQITVISLDRCICVMLPVWCHNHRRPRLAFIIVLIIWIGSIALSLPFIVYSDIAEIHELMICTLKIDESDWAMKTMLDLVLFFLLPFIIIVSCYIVIVLYSKKKRIFASSRPLKTIAAVIIAFFICWFPIRLFTLLLTFEGRLFDFYSVYYGFLITNLLIVLNSCINPILYVFIGRDFKEKFWGSFQATLEKAFIEEDKSASEKQERCTALQSLQ
ncbi:chemerin-like receptor 1 [Hyla sarda]|uniref:chemerin-like receptor 1 n=1 Tax=Hyla sarda TaxID=327740 RepID=UPI0024C43D2E|nr:chemerin-like receptor 1 [Hyla sarda]